MRRQPLGMRLGMVALLLGLGGCAEQALPGPPITPRDCLLDFHLDHLDAALERCTAVVAAFPHLPGPLNDRYLLHSLAGNNAAACRDLAKAVQLARRLPSHRLDRLLREDLRLRQKSCQP